MKPWTKAVNLDTEFLQGNCGRGLGRGDGEAFGGISDELPVKRP